MPHAPLARTTVYDHDADLNVRLVTEHDFMDLSQSTAEGGAIASIPVGTALRKTETTYLVNDPSVDAGTRAAYRARDLISLPTSATPRTRSGRGRRSGTTSRATTCRSARSCPPARAGGRPRPGA